MKGAKDSIKMVIREIGVSFHKENLMLRVLSSFVYRLPVFTFEGENCRSLDSVRSSSHILFHIHTKTPILYQLLCPLPSARLINHLRFEIFLTLTKSRSKNVFFNNNNNNNNNNNL